MSALTPIGWKRFEKFLLFIGCKFSRQKGDHRIYQRSGLKRPIVIIRDELPVFIIRNNLRTLGVSVDDYLGIVDAL